MPEAIPPKVTSHGDDAVARVPGFESGSTGITGLVRVLATGPQAIEDALDDLLNKRAISTGEGAQLDILGEVLDLDRASGQTDTSYATTLLGRAASISADSGTLEQLLQVYSLIIGATKVYAIDLQPATVELTALAVDDGSPADADILSAMSETKAAGVQLILQVVESSELLFGDTTLADASGDLPADADHGWGDTADADAFGDIAPGAGKGGNWARVIT